MKLRTPYRSLMTVSAILTAVLFVAWALLIHGSYALRNDIASISAKAESVSAREAYLVSLQNALKDSGDDLALIDGRFITKDGIPTFTDMLDAKALAAGVKADIGSLNLDETGDARTPHALAIHMTGSGAWKNVASFISTVESLPYAIRIDGASLAVADARSGSWNFSIDASVSVVN